MITGVDGRIIDANDAFLRMVGYGREDLAAGLLRWTELTPAKWQPATARQLAKVKATGIGEPYEKEFLRKDGTCVPVLVGSALFDNDKSEAVAFVVDLSDRKRAEEAARESERRYHEIQIELAHANRVATVGHLSASIAHEINQPLSGIITNASTGVRMLAADPPNIDGAVEAARRIIRDGNRASEVIRRLRALFAKTDTATELLDLNEAIRDVIALSMAELRRRDVLLHLKLAEDPVPVRADRIQLQQVMLNLVRNAVDSMSAVDDRPRQLVIGISKAGSDALVTVEDSGQGLDPANLGRVFEAFYSTKPGGLGMGLSICRTIVETHGGKLWATPAVPHGVVFRFTLPMSAGAAA
jgi:PAS domain S-box-containing protein